MQKNWSETDTQTISHMLYAFHTLFRKLLLNPSHILLLVKPQLAQDKQLSLLQLMG